MQEADGVRLHDAAELGREPLEILRGGAVVLDGRSRVEGEVGRHCAECAVANRGGAIGIALVSSFGLSAPDRNGEREGLEEEARHAQR